MTQVAKMILNELPISPTINEKIEFIKSSKLDFKDFNSFRLLLNSLEGFEPSSKLSPNEYKAQINRRIGAFLERLNVLEEKIKNTQNLEIEQESKPNEALSKDDNREDSLSDRAKYFYLLAEIETFANKEEQDSQTLGKLLEKTSELLLNAENLNDDEIDTLEETKESLQEYFIHLKQNEEEKESSNTLLSNENEELQILESQSDDTMKNVSESQKDLPQSNIRFDEAKQILMVGDDVYRMGADGFVYKISNYGGENQFSEKNQKLNPQNLKLDDMYREHLEGLGINVDEIFKTQDSNSQHTIKTSKTSLFDDEEVKPPKKRMS
ncbi:hypothetical protein MKD52_08365 [Helicobacter sp. CaF467b]|uniref:hypothetical protein n=1 Tax=Helicobacter sp. CaF467b TaxID=2919923 RepID=UPI001F58CA8E|nr:hypothetical protein [Helicobacter sp. CaF467b]MCI2236840.1 hypothetical protein [Helicobacter sp. CaF467b]